MSKQSSSRAALWIILRQIVVLWSYHTLLGKHLSVDNGTIRWFSVVSCKYGMSSLLGCILACLGRDVDACCGHLVRSQANHWNKENIKKPWECQCSSKVARSVGKQVAVKITLGSYLLSRLHGAPGTHGVAWGYACIFLRYSYGIIVINYYWKLTK